MEFEAVRQAEGRIAARRCWEAARVAVSEETKDALQRAAIRYALKAIGIDARDEVATTPGRGNVVAGLTFDEGSIGQTFTRSLGLGGGARDWNVG